MKHICLILLTAIVVTGCSTVQKVGLRATADMLDQANKEMTREPDLEFFASATPGNIQLMEGLWYVDQSNQVILSNLIKAYGGYGFAIAETNYLANQLRDIQKGPFKDSAITAYSKAFKYGVKYFQLKGIDAKLLKNPTKLEELREALVDKLDEDDKIAVFYAAQAWGGLINLQRNNMALMNQVANVKALMDWVCSQDPEFENGSCHLFYAVYEASRPPMLGGSLEKAKMLFEKFIEKYPYHLFARVAYVQYYIIPVMDEDLYAQQSAILGREFNEWSKMLNIGNDHEQKSPYLKHTQYNLYNAVAKKRYEIIESLKNEIF